MTVSAIKNWDFEAALGISVQKIYTLVMNNGRDKYQMSGGGSGCRYWVYVIIKDLEENGCLLKKGAAKEIWEKLLFQYSNTGHTKPLAMIQGVFTSGKSKASASHSSTSASAPASGPTIGARIQVQVRKYQANGQLCYSWEKDGVEDRGYAKDWTAFTDKKGKPGVFHREINIFSSAP